MILRRCFAWLPIVLICAPLKAQTPAERPPLKDPQLTRTSMIWQLPDDRMGVRTAPILLLSRDDVARDIGLTSDQRQKTWEKIADLGRRATDLKGRNDKEVNVLRRSIDQSQLDWLRTELKPVQLARLTQIDLQWEGPSAILSRPQVAEALHLTADQKSKIQAIFKDVPKQSADMPPSLAKVDLTKRVFRELDETQQQSWRALTGPEFGAIPRTASSK